MAYPQLTPSHRARGVWKLRTPFAVVTDVEYTCIAIRTFDDMYNDGIDPYKEIYVPVGLSDGVAIGTETFSFAQERLLGINIISLADPKGQVYHVPDNYILSYPTTSGILYEHFIMSASLGALPSTIDMTDAQTAMKQSIKDSFGVDATINVHRVSTLTSPTYEEHLELERIREAAKKIDNTLVAKNEELERKLTLANDTVQTLTQILIDNNLMPT
jgi:hypothetical protein